MKRRMALFAILTAAVLFSGCGSKINSASGQSGEGSNAGSEAADNNGEGGGNGGGGNGGGSQNSGGSGNPDLDDPDYDATLKNPYPQVQNGEDVRVVMEDGKVVVVTDDGSFIEQLDQGLEWTYLGGTVRMLFPLDWDDRFLIRGTKVFCKKCFVKQENTGELFSIEFIRDTDMNSDPSFSALIGGTKKFYTVVTVPQQASYDTSDPDLSMEYNDMAADLSGIFRSAACLFTKGFTPIDLSVYAPAGASSSSKLFGTWTEDTQNAGGYTPKAIFRADDSAFAYRTSESQMLFGTFKLNRNAAGYVWNTENWGDAGLVFAAGQVYRVTYYESEPMKLEFEPLFPFEQESPIGRNKFTYNSDAQNIYDTDNTGSSSADPEG